MKTVGYIEISVTIYYWTLLTSEKTCITKSHKLHKQQVLGRIGL